MAVDLVEKLDQMSVARRVALMESMSVVWMVVKTVASTVEKMAGTKVVSRVAWMAAMMAA